MDLGELVSVNMIVDEKHDDTCSFCKSTEKPKKVANDLEANPDEDAVAELDGPGEDAADALDSSVTVPDLKFKNDAGKLGNAMGGKPDHKVVKLGGKPFNAAVAAHHLIPGNASLKKSQLFLSEEYLWKDGEVMGNIGYNINSAENGVWSPGNYGVRPWGTEGAGFVAKNPELSPEDFAYAAMDAWRTQFHDAHEKYSDFVKDCLDKIFEKLEDGAELWCPEAKKKKEKKPDEKEPLYVLVQRLNTVSGRMKRMLTFPTKNWKTNIYTSRFVQTYMVQKKHRK